MTTLTDNFNDGVDGANVAERAGWSEHLGIYRAIVAASGQVGGDKLGAGSGPGGPFFDCGAANHAAEADLAQLISNKTALVVRFTDNLHWVGMMQMGTGGAGLRLVKRVASTRTDLDTMQGVAGDRYRIEAVTNGSVTEYAVYVNGSPTASMAASVPNSEISGTNQFIGLVNETANGGDLVPYWDNFYGEPLGGGTTVVDSDHQSAINFSAAVNADRAWPVSSTSAIVADAVSALTWSAAVARQVALQTAALEGINADTPLPVLTFTSIIADTKLPISWQGAFVVNADAPVPVGWVSNLVSDLTAPVDWPTRLDKLFPMPVALTNQMDRSLVLPVSYAQAVHNDSPAPVAWQGALVVNADRDLPIDWVTATNANQPLPLGSVTAITTDQPMPVTNRAGIVADQVATLDWLSGLLVDHGLPADWSGTLIVNSDQPLPISWGGVSGFVDCNVNLFHLDARSVLWQLSARSVTWAIKPH